LNAAETEALLVSTKTEEADDETEIKEDVRGPTEKAEEGECSTNAIVI